MYSDSPRCVYQKVVLCLFAAMAVIFAVWTAVSRADGGVLFRNVLLEVSEQGDTKVYSGERYGTAVTITCREENGAKLVNFSADEEYYAVCRVEYPEGTIRTEFGTEVMRITIIRNDEVLFSGGYDPDPTINSHMHYFNEDGTWSMDPMVSIQAVSGADPWYDFEFDIADILRFANGPDLSVRGSWLHYFITLSGSILGALVTAFPYTLFYFRHFLSVRDPEPTELYLLGHRIGSILYAVGIFFLYLKGVHTVVYRGFP